MVSVLLRGHILAAAELERMLEATGLRALEAWVLRIVTNNPRMTMARLRINTGLRASTLSSIADRLERRGYLRRERDEEGDRRYVRVHATSDGRVIATFVDSAFESLDSRIRERTHPDDLGSLIVVVDAIDERTRPIPSKLN